MNSENPAVNRYLKDKQIDRVDHALGRPLFPLRKSHRNYFATEADSDLAQEFAASPWWRKTGRSWDMVYFGVTTAGRAALAAYLAAAGDEWRPFEVTFEGHRRIVPARSAAKARYSYFLIVSEVLPDMSFKQFAKTVKVRRIAG